MRGGGERGIRRRTTTAVLLLAATLVTLIVHGPPAGYGDGSLLQITPTRPDPGVGMAAARRAPKPGDRISPFLFDVALVGGNRVTYMGHQPANLGGGPIRWDPCRDIHWVVNTENEPLGGRSQLRRAFAEASKKTGFRFIEDGVTKERFGEYPARMYLPNLYGDRWSPLLIVWTPNLKAENGDKIIGLAGPTWTTRKNGERVWVSGAMQLNATSFQWWATKSPSKYAKTFPRATILHELGHILGLGHSDDMGDLMFGQITPLSLTYKKGDLAGLSIISSGSCVPDV